MPNFCCINPSPVPAELGIDIGAILQKTKAILLHQMRSQHLEEVDMGGALLFLLLFSSLHLLVRCVGQQGHMHGTHITRTCCPREQRGSLAG